MQLHLEIRHRRAPSDDALPLSLYLAQYRNENGLLWVRFLFGRALFELQRHETGRLGRGTPNRPPRNQWAGGRSSNDLAVNAVRSLQKPTGLGRSHAS